MKYQQIYYKKQLYKLTENERGEYDNVYYHYMWEVEDLKLKEEIIKFANYIYSKNCKFY